MERLADRIRKARRLLCLTQTQAAQLMAVHRGTVGHWERGAGHQPTNANLMQLAVLLGVTYEWLATGRGSMHPLRFDDAEATVQEGCCINCGDEEALLLAFRKLSAKRRKAIVQFVRSGSGPKDPGSAALGLARQR